MTTPQPPQAGGYGQFGPQGQPGPQGHPGPQGQPGPYAPQAPQNPQNPHQQGPYPQNPYPQGQFPPGPHPQAPYAQGPYGQGPGGWGAPPPPPPRKVAGTVWGGIGIAVAIVAGVLLLSLWGNRDEGGPSSGSGSFPEAEYRLTLPETLLDGEYTLAQDLSSKGPQSDGTWDESNIRDMKPAIGQYTGKEGATSGKALVVTGMYGRVKDHDEARASLSEGAATAENTKTAVAAKDIEVGGETVRCQVLTMDQAGATAVVPMCSWADDNTAAGVAVVDQGTAAQEPESIDLEQTARTTLKVRDEMREPLN